MFWLSMPVLVHSATPGPAKSGYFQWMQDEETGEMKPVTRLKKKNIERNPSYWDRVFDKDDADAK